MTGDSLSTRVETGIRRADIPSMVGQIVMNCFIVTAADLSSPVGIGFAPSPKA